MTLYEIALSELEELFSEIRAANTKTDFLPAVQRFLNNLENQLFFKSMINTLDYPSNPLSIKAKEIALQELKGEQWDITDNALRKIVAYYIIKNLNDINIHSIDINYIKTNYLIPFWNTLKRSLNTHENILYWLLRYQKRTVLYDSEKILQELATFRKNSKRIEEDFFAPRINKYLFDRGIDIISEPKIRGKRVDVFGKIVSKQGYSDFILEYKVFLKTQTNKKRYLQDAFFQAYRYAKYHYQKNIVYLVIFIIGEGDIKLNLDQLTLETDLSIPYFEFDNVRIIVIKVILKQGSIKNEINKDDLITFFNQKLAEIER